MIFAHVVVAKNLKSVMENKKSVKFIIGSSSERKIKISEEIIKELFPNQTIEVGGYKSVSGVPETPYDKQTFDGSRNRALDAKANIIGADFYIGMESGLIERYGHIYEEAWSTVIDSSGQEFYGYSSGLKVPDYILKKMDELKMAHCEVMTIIEAENGKLPNDTWGTYSGGMIARTVSLKESLRNALIQLVADRGFYKK